MSTVIDTTKHQVTATNAAKIKDWLDNRGGLLIWESVDLSNPGTMTSPFKNADGTPVTKPHWRLSNEPIRHITSSDDVEVCIDTEVKRFRVGVRRGGQGLSLKVTDGGTRKIRAAVEKAGVGAYYKFDYMTQEAVIMATDKVIPLAEWCTGGIQTTQVADGEINTESPNGSGLG